MEKQDEANEFGEFGEIEVKNCHICGKTIRQKSCYGFTRAKDEPKYNGVMQSNVYSNQPKSHICLKCLLKGLYSICKDKEKINEYLDLYIKTAITETLIEK